MRRSLSKNFKFLSVILILFFTLFSFFTGIKVVFGDDSMEARHLVEKARFTFENFSKAREMEGFRGLAKKAKGIFIAPQILKGAVIFGASGGSGVFIVHDQKKNTWAGPAFYTLGEASFGLQVGGEAAEVIMLVMSDRGVSALLSNSVKLGADVGIAMGPVGVGIDASSANVSADIITFSMSKGLYGGISLEGAFIKTRNGWNRAYYGKEVTPTDILIKNNVKNPHSSSLIEQVKGLIEGKN